MTSRADAANNSISYTYNNQGLLAFLSNAVGQVVAHKYDVRDRPTNTVDANGVSVNITYDNLSRMLTRSFPDGGVEKFEYSPRGLISFTNQLTFVTRNGYDVLARKTKETNANNVKVSVLNGP